MKNKIVQRVIFASVLLVFFIAAYMIGSDEEAIKKPSCKNWCCKACA